MKFKGIDDFTIEDCREFLRHNPEGEWASAVRNRMRVLQQEEGENRKKMEREQGEKRSEQSESMGEKIRWKDFKREVDEKQWILYGYRIRKKKPWGKAFICLLLAVVEFILCGLCVFLVEGGDIMMVIGFFVVLIVGYIWVLLFLHVIFYPTKIYDIENSSSNVRRIRNREGRIGLARLGEWGRLKLLPMVFDAISPCRANIYVCRKGGKYGAYNVERRKMVVPVEYDEIELREGVFEVIKDGVRERFTENGFRVVE